MPLPAKILVPTRNQERERILRDMRFRGPDGMDTSPGTQADIDARWAADAMTPAYANTVAAGDNLVLGTKSGDELTTYAANLGFDPPRLLAKGATGAVTIQAVSGGVPILVGTKLFNPANGVRYETTIPGLYQDGSDVQVKGTDTGTGTNLDAGTKLQFVSPPLGLGSECVVAADPDGEGLTGGRADETDAELIARIQNQMADPPAAGNDAAYQQAIENAVNAPVEKAFTYPAIRGPGTVGITFTVRPTLSGGSRIPSPTELAAVAGEVSTQFPADDGQIVIALVASPVDVDLGVTWRRDVATWADSVPWPPYLTGTSSIVIGGTPTPDTSTFQVVASGGVYAGTPQPQVGQTIAVYDRDARKFQPKRILSFTGTGPWVITVDPALGASDTTYAPVAGQRVCPWSASLDKVVAPVLEHFDGIGPGEQYASFFDEGSRQRRSPESPKLWPDRVSNRLIVDVAELSSVADVELNSPAVPYVTPVGTPTVSSYLLELRYLAVFPQT